LFGAGEAILVPEVHNMANITTPEQCPRFVLSRTEA